MYSFLFVVFLVGGLWKVFTAQTSNLWETVFLKCLKMPFIFYVLYNVMKLMVQSNEEITDCPEYTSQYPQYLKKGGHYYLSHEMHLCFYH